MSELKEEEIDPCHSDAKLTDSNQSSLRTVLVRSVRIEKPAAKKSKRVRFNSLVEVKFIPKCKSEKKKKRKSQVDYKEKTEPLEVTTKKTYHRIQARRKDINVKGELNLHAQRVPTTTETSHETEVGDSCTGKGPESCEIGLNLDKNRSTAKAKSMLNRQTVHKKTGTDKDSTRLNGCALKSRVTVRKSYVTNKVTLVGDYNGKALRLCPSTFTVAPDLQVSEFSALNTKRKNVQEFGYDRALWRLEKQAAKFCEEAKVLIAKVTENTADMQSHLKVQPDTTHLAGNYRQIFPTEHIKEGFTKSENVKDPSSFGKTASRDVFSTTRFPHITHKKQQSIVGPRQKSSSELYLPQLLFYDGIKTRSPVGATDDSRGTGTVNKEAPGKFELIPGPEEARNGKIVISYSYGATKKLGC
ncbi:uncharacterized protein LOC111343342 [Stylophora pistillata]|nr:uncharacterized protein LOC111343342 [Stylophora pistillata]